MGAGLTVLDVLRRAKLVFWDFDGVVKESVEIKTCAFVRLFERYGPGVAARVKAHHEANGGMSRFQKFPVYLGFAGEPSTRERVDALCEDFSRLVMQEVIDCPWVPGVEDYLRTNPHAQRFVLVSATPQEEIERIVDALDLRPCFTGVVGSPTTKAEGIRAAMRRLNVPPADCVLVGDARGDREAAAAAGIPFILRRHATNGDVSSENEELVLNDFCLA